MKELVVEELTEKDGDMKAVLEFIGDNLLDFTPSEVVIFAINGFKAGVAMTRPPELTAHIMGHMIADEYSNFGKSPTEEMLSKAIQEAKWIRSGEKPTLKMQIKAFLKWLVTPMN